MGASIAGLNGAMPVFAVILDRLWLAMAKTFSKGEHKYSLSVCPSDCRRGKRGRGHLLSSIDTLS